MGNSYYLFRLSFENLIFLYPNKLCWQKSQHLLAWGLSQTHWGDVGCACVFVKARMGKFGGCVGVWQCMGAYHRDLALLVSLGGSQRDRQSGLGPISVCVQEKKHLLGHSGSKPYYTHEYKVSLDTYKHTLRLSWSRVGIFHYFWVMLILIEDWFQIKTEE